MNNFRQHRKNCLVIIPAFNEELNIGNVIDKIRLIESGFDIVVVDDHSSDRTASIAAERGVPVISHSFNIGYGGALQTGYKFALEHGYDFIAQLDADGQHEPSFLVKMFSIIRKGGTDIVLGSRHLSLKSYRIPIIRRLGQLFFGKMISIIIGKRITDPTTGYQAFTCEVVEYMVRDSFPYNYLDANSLLLLYFSGFRIKELPVRMYSGNGSKSMHSGLFRPMRYIIEMMISIFLVVLRQKIIKEEY